MAISKAKLIQTELKAVTLVPPDIQSISSELALDEIGQVTFFIDHAKDDDDAPVGQGTEYVIQASEKATGNDTWRSLTSFTATITAPTVMTMDAAEAAGQTVIECGATTPAVGDILFFYNSTITNSEWATVVGRSNTVSVTLESGLTNAQGGTAATIYTQGEHFVQTIDVESLLRARVICNNTKGTTNRQICWRCAAITSSVS